MTGRDGQTLPIRMVAVLGGRFDAAELISLAIGKYGDSDRHDHGGDDEHEDSTPQTLNHAGSRRGGLGVAESAVLGVRDRTEREHRESRKKRFHDAHPGMKYGDSHNSTPSLFGERAHVEKPKAI